MARKEKALTAPPAAGTTSRALPIPFFWIPSLLLLFIPVWEMALSLQAPNFPPRLFWVHHNLLISLSAICWIVAAVAASLPPFRKAIASHLDSLAKAPRATRLAWLVTAYLGLVVWTSFVRYAQYRSFQLPQDTAVSLNEAYTFLHHGSLYLSIFGVHQFSIHIFLLMPLLSPILLLWNSPLPLLFSQNLFVCAAPFAVYALAAETTGSSFAGAIGLLLVVSSATFYQLISSNLLYAPLVALLPWAMYFFERRRWVPFAVLIALMNVFPEQVPFIFFGLGLYLMTLREGARRPYLWIGGAVCAISVALWVGETSLIKHFSAHESAQNYAGSTYWLMFKDLVPAGTPYERIFPELISHPFRTAANLLSIYRFYPLLRLMFSMGFFCLLAPAALLPVLTSALPHILAASHDPVKFLEYYPVGYSDFGLHQGAYVFGPLLWATGLGLRRAHRELSKRGLASWLLVWALIFSGFGFEYAHRSLMPDWRPRWFDALPPVLAAVPPKARVWAEEYASPPLALRRWIKIIQWGPTEPNGYDTLFMPDYVLLDKAFVYQATPPFRDELLTFLGKNGFIKIAESDTLVLFKNPTPASDPEADVDHWIHLPSPDVKEASRFANYFVNGPVSPR